ncbi:mannose-1-phosphate guanylyltransferase/mannose-6-phosphate isomerase [Paraburkholderia sp. SARCC-3016]|uniref:mannose-1-phosphate guanylyltransferase/mannose-6-phosphate isomerase n=1 Tax=Paraburkholderia sp. SARCC-3016 TaxID=3058611 RepID=UPI002809C573|nr:mannose-1-phosphate guanylyltransferase/mannose-6-phosphate isomerase [Paraburkholderia sp. SARCC-3016]MDQ7978077.1 mannose-1-phosphate guanylyltransferase/mannose-6-phosphate isomerase [Paraburkholderia sp. SARCC-3016]
MKIIPVIICGGAGTRLWPVSREAFPKPLLKLADGQSLLQKTFVRASNVADTTEVLFVTSRDTYFLTKDECIELEHNVSQIGFILEPMARNTAAAIGVAAEVVRERHGPDAIMLVMPADQLIENESAFRTAVEHAAATAQHGALVTFGIRPTSPETGYGYIGHEELPIEGTQVVHKVVHFVEKPELNVAKELVADGRHLWNAGMFCFRADSLLDELETFAPDVFRPALAAVAEAKRSSSDEGYVVELDAARFRSAENISIDYAVMERSSKVTVVPCEMGWSDIGSWQSISALTQPDERGNRVHGTAELHDVDNCFVRSNGRLIGVVGVHDLIVVDTEDALLIAARDRAQDVKHIVSKLKAANHDAYRLHRTVHRPWGTYTVLEEGDRFKMKRIVVKPGAALSLQMHHHRSEHWIVVRGCAEIVNGEQTISLQPNESTYIPAGHRHRLINPGVVPLVLIEVQCGEYLGEDDIVRFEDVYGRAPVN